MGIKRWIALTIFGIVLLSMGFVIIISEEKGQASLGTSLIIIIGVLAIITGTKRIVNSLITILLPPPKDKELVDIVYRKRQLEKGPRLTVIGGGRGFVNILKGLKEITSNISAIVTMIDEGSVGNSLSGGSGLTVVHDVRDGLIALADAEPVVERLFRYRFKKGTELWGYNFGNIFISALSDIVGSFDGALKESSKVLAIRGEVILSTLSKVSLIAIREDGSETIGKHRILNSIIPIKRVQLRPQTVEVTKEALQAIEKADAIIFGAGNLYTTTIPSFLINGLLQAVLDSKAVKIYMLNLMTKFGETDNYLASDHLKAIFSHTSENLITYCVANSTLPPTEILKKYEAEESFPVKMDKDNLKKLKCKFFETDLLDISDGYIRHHPEKISKAVSIILNESKRTRLYTGHF